MRWSTIDSADLFIESHVEREAKENISERKSEGLVDKQIGGWINR